MPPVISVIIPAYNAGRFLEETLACVIAQDFKDWELLLIDDGSTDGTAAICDRAAAGDKRIRAIHRPNGGPSLARNRGLDEAGGQWIYFMDADDLIPRDALSTLIETAEKHSADIVLAPCRIFDKKPPQAHRGPAGGQRVLTGIEAVETGMYQRGIDIGPCGKLYKAELWNGLRFRNGIIYEDLDIFYRLWSKAAKVILLKTTLYYYRQHESSLMHTFNRRRLDALDVTDRMTDWAAGKHVELFPAARDRRMSAHFNIFLLMHKLGAVDPEAERRCISVIRDSAPASLCNGRVRAKNRLGALAFIIGGPWLLKRLACFVRS